jgi:hypothetical protein
VPGIGARLRPLTVMGSSFDRTFIVQNLKQLAHSAFSRRSGENSEVTLSVERVYAEPEVVVPDCLPDT